MAGTPSSDSEMVFGLNPRALLAPRGAGAFLRAWTPPTAGTIARLFPHFEITGMIGRGGMGAVYRARQPDLDRTVALKLLPMEAASDAAFAGRFRTEARALAQLQHPHIVTIYDSGQTEEGHLYFVMEYVDGSDLAQLLKQGPLPVDRALIIARAVGEALEYAHARSIVHRDIKPANVLLGGDGSIKVADFGLARLPAALDEAEERLTITGSALGTPAYMSPEQRAGAPVDGRSDLYSLGVMFYEMLTGHLPEGAWHPPSRQARCSSRVDSVVEQLMQRDPAGRFQSAVELGVRLEHLQNRLRPAARHRLKAGLLAGLVAGAAIIALGTWGQPASTPGPALSIVSHPAPAAPLAGAAPLSPPGTLTPFTGLDLKVHSKNGNWQWVDGRSGSTLAISQAEPGGSPKTLLLPVYPGTRAFDLSCEVLLEQLGSSLTFTLPAGRARVAFVFDLYDNSGLEFIRGRDWKNNSTAVVARMETGRFVPLHLSVRPEGERVRINVALKGKPFTQWEGPQADLSIGPDDVLQYLIDRPDPIFALSTITGAVQVRNLTTTIHP